MRCSEDYHLERLVRLLQTLHQVRSQIDASAHGLLPREVNLENHVRVLRLNIIDTVDQRLVHVKDEHFLVFRVPRFGQSDEFVHYFFFGDDC